MLALILGVLVILGVIVAVSASKDKTFAAQAAMRRRPDRESLSSVRCIFWICNITSSLTPRFCFWRQNRFCTF